MPFIDSKISVSVSQEKKDAYSKMSGEVCNRLNEELGIPGDKVYVTYREVSDWGWNGRNFYNSSV